MHTTSYLLIYLLTNLLTYLLTCSLHGAESLRSQLVCSYSRNSPHFTEPEGSLPHSHLSLSWASPIQSIYPHPTSWRSVLILSTHLRLSLPRCFLPSGFPTKTLYTPLSSPIRATCPAHLILLDFITHTMLVEEYKSFSSSLCNLLHSSVTPSFLGPNILLNTMFSNTLSFVSSRNVSDQVSHYFLVYLFQLLYMMSLIPTSRPDSHPYRTKNTSVAEIQWVLLMMGT